MASVSWREAARLPISQDLALLNQWLSQHQVQHRFTIEGDKQVLWISDPGLLESITELVANWNHLEAGAASEIAATHNTATEPAGFDFPIAPLTLALLFGSFLGFALVSLGIDFFRLFLFYEPLPPFRADSDAWFFIRQGEYWRLITPIFLHFGIIHILFNALWLWFLGVRIERVFGSFSLLILVLLLGVSSNIAQAIVSFPIPFGGVSGVVYGLFSFVWLLGVTTREPSFRLPPALFPLMFVFLIISWFGVFDMLAGGEVADTAHTTGFVGGLICAGVMLGYRRLRH